MFIISENGQAIAITFAVKIVQQKGYIIYSQSDDHMIQGQKWVWNLTSA